jgi:hypothetical protein
MEKLKADQLREELRTAGWLLIMCAALIAWLAASAWGWFAAAWIAACGAAAIQIVRGWAVIFLVS